VFYAVYGVGEPTLVLVPSNPIVLIGDFVDQLTSRR
jgi:hypothetical protein